jgi:recombination protein RecA
VSKATELMAAINKQLGTDALRMGSDPTLEVEYIPTGMLPFDLLTQGGVARGRFVEVYGPYSTLKSYIALSAIREVQQAGGVAALADTEHAYDPVWATECGVNTAELILVAGETGEEKLDSAEVLIRNEVDLIVVDSIAAILPQQEANKRLHREGVQPGRTAALMSLASRKLTAANSRTAVLWINQLRESIGVTFGPTEKTTGGRAMGYYASQRIKIKPAGKVTEDRKVYTGDGYKATKLQIAQTFVASLEKSKLNTPHGEIYFDWDLRTGSIDLVKFLFAQCVENGALTNRGASWTYEPTQTKVVGRENFFDAMRADPALLAHMLDTVRTRAGLAPLTAVKPPPQSTPAAGPAPKVARPRIKKAAPPKPSPETIGELAASNAP